MTVWIVIEGGDILSGLGDLGLGVAGAGLNLGGGLFDATMNTDISDILHFLSQAAAAAGDAGEYFHDLVPKIIIVFKL